MAKVKRPSLDRPPEPELQKAFYIGIVPAVRAIRAQTDLSLVEATALIANTFGFQDVQGANAWQQCRRWLEVEQIGLHSIQGPHARTLLKMLAIKHGRYNVSEQPK